MRIHSGDGADAAREVADGIEELEAEVDRLRDRIEELERDLADVTAERDDLAAAQSP